MAVPNRESTATRILLVDDHPLCTEMLAQLLCRTGEFDVVGIAGRGQVAIECCARTRPDLMLLDLMLPDISGLEVIQAVRGAGLSMPIVVCSGLETDEAIRAAFLLGANGFVEKTLEVPRLVEILRQAARGEFPFSRRVGDVLREMVLRRRIEKQITPRDVKILRLYATTHDVKQVALRAGISPSAVRKAISRLCIRTGVTRKWELPAVATRLGLLAPSVPMSPPAGRGTAAPRKCAADRPATPPGVQEPLAPAN